MSRSNDISPRFYAEWISKQSHNEDGEWLPDEDEYSRVQCRDLKEAQRVAVENGKACNVVEWVCVFEEHFNPEMNIPSRHPAAWDTVRVWWGGWQGNWNEDRS